MENVTVKNYHFSLTPVFHHKVLFCLVSLYSVYLFCFDADDEQLFGVRENLNFDESQPNENVNAIYQQWEEFAVIATNLLEKIETYMESIHQGSLHQSLPMNQLNISPSASSEKRFNPWEEIPPPNSPSTTTSH